MRKSVLCFLILIAVLTLTLISAAQEYVPNQLLIVTRSIESESRLQEMNTSCGTRIERLLAVMTRGKIYLLQITDERSVENAMDCWQQFPEVEFAEPNYLMKPMK